MLKDFFGKKVKVINLGIASFAEDLRKQGVETVHTDWRPPAGGNKKIQALLDKVASWQSKVKSAKGAR
ncbi:MAG: hypothetical protein GQF41_2647 [Candidatus Rifleibacterium amylolyticum]|nr:MAG: hypothetical protein GQF41_2647 [Candidatus Rifleibacterium amylolyticum]NLF96567.1 fdrA domain protein [Candidatus Riflebacteria bacterium]